MLNTKLVKVAFICTVLITLLISQGCTDSKQEIVNIDFKVASVDFRIPSSFLSYSDDYNGGVQDTITINAAYPSMKPSLAEFSNSLGAGRGGRILLHSRGTSSVDAWRSFTEFRGHKIIGTEKIFELTKHLTVDASLLDRYTYNKNNEVFMMISCPKRTAPHNIIICSNKHKVINEKIYVSYIFEESLLSDIEALNYRVENLILGFKI